VAVYRVTMLQQVRNVVDVTAESEGEVWEKMALMLDRSMVKQEHLGATLESIVKLDG
jgi:hypothetical protein